jgi:hypothetical protein
MTRPHFNVDGESRKAIEGQGRCYPEDHAFGEITRIAEKYVSNILKTASRLRS